MAGLEVRSPVEGFTGVVAGVAFADGRATFDPAERPGALAYMRRHGYGITTLATGGVHPPPAPEPPSSDRPRNNASREAWVAFALTQGATDEDLADLSRDDLVALYPLES